MEQRISQRSDCEDHQESIDLSTSPAAAQSSSSRQISVACPNSQHSLLCTVRSSCQLDSCTAAAVNGFTQVSGMTSRFNVMTSSLCAPSILSVFTSTSSVFAVGCVQISRLRPITTLLVITWCLAMILSQGRLQVKAVEIFSSTAHVRRLLESEGTLVESLRHYLKYEQARIDLITRYMNEIKDRTKDPSHVIADHPLNAFNLIQRFDKIWVNVWGYAQDFRAYEALRDVVQRLEIYWPTVSDYPGAKVALVRLQQTYGLPLDQLANGKIFNHVTLPLSQETLFEIANQAIEKWDGKAATDWMAYTMNHTLSPTVPQDQLHAAMGRAVALTGDYQSALRHVQKAVAISPNDSAHILNLLPNQTSSPPYHQRQPEVWSAYTRLCRLGVSQPDSLPEADGTVDEVPTVHNLICFYRSRGTDPLRRYKIEELSRAPEVFLVREFIHQSEAEEIIGTAVGNIERARVGKTLNESSVSESRVGKVAWLPHASLLMQRLNERASAVMQLNVNERSSEELQVGNYGMGGHYEAHMDALEMRWMEGNDSNIYDDRIATLMIYLNDVTEGGATVFPLANLSTRPVKHAAIFWYNYKRNGFIDPLTLHAGCPVLIGEKWVANKWIHEWGQEFARPCDLDPNI